MDVRPVDLVGYTKKRSELYMLFYENAVLLTVL
jgi:hypothetical protein